MDYFWIFGQFLMWSMLSIGGAITVAPDIYRVLGLDTALLTYAQFSSAITIAQIAPGPNLLYVAVIGYQLAGVLGLLVVLLGIMIPSTTIALTVARWIQLNRSRLAVKIIGSSFGPIVVGLLFATGWTLGLNSPDLFRAAVVIIVAFIVFLTRVHFLALIFFGAILGAMDLL